MWFDKNSDDVVYVDIREVVKPQVLADTRNLPFRKDSFDLVLFDPPFTDTKQKGESNDYWVRLWYGSFSKKEIINLIYRTSRQIAPVLKANGHLIFKWGDNMINLTTIVSLMEPFKALFGHKTASRSINKNSVYWLYMVKR